MIKYYVNLLAVILISHATYAQVTVSDIEYTGVVTNVNKFTGNESITSDLDGTGKKLAFVSDDDANIQRTISVTSGTHTITGNSIFFSNIRLEISSGATLNIVGDVYWSNRFDIVLNGTLDVTGDLNTTSLPGTFNYTYQASEGGGISFTGNGTFDVSGTYNKGNIDMSSFTGTDLPVELVSFTGNFDNDNFILEWNTTSEQNASHFTIESSVDNLTWNAIGKVDAAGNSNTTIKYNFNCGTLKQNTYFRLVQVDFDGSYEIFGPLLANQNQSLAQNIKLYPNVLGNYDRFNLEVLDTNINQSFQLEIHSTNGQLVFSSSDKNIIKDGLQINNYDAGLYIVSIVYGQQKVHKRLMVK